MPDKQEGALSIYRILDLTDQRGTFCARLLADMGADVIKIEKPQGGEARNIPPFAGDLPHPEKSIYFLYRNANKKGITLNIETPDGKAIFEKLVKSVDVVVESGKPGYLKGLGLDYKALKEINPGLVMASITDFGQDGPYRDWKSSDLVDFAMSGAMIGSGYPDGKPTALPGSPGDDAASYSAAISIVTSLYMRGSTGKGQYIDASIHENSRLGLYPWGLIMWYSNVKPNQPLPPQAGRMGTMIYPVFPCKDGYIRAVALTPRQWDCLVEIIGKPEVLCTEEWREFYYRIGNADALNVLVSEYTQQYTMQELFEKGNEAGVPIAPIYDIKGFVESAQTQAREFFVELDHPVVGKYKCPGTSFKCKDSSFGIRYSAPCLGQHNEDILCEELGLSINDLAALRRAGVI